MGSQHPSEDWFNHVVPALMYFRAIVEHSGMKVTRFALDAHSGAAFKDATPPVGSGIEGAQAIRTYPPNLEPAHEAKLSEFRLKKFIKDAADSLS